MKYLFTSLLFVTMIQTTIATHITIHNDTNEIAIVAIPNDWKLFATKYAEREIPNPHRAIQPGGNADIETPTNYFTISRREPMPPAPGDVGATYRIKATPPQATEAGPRPLFAKVSELTNPLTKSDFEVVGVERGRPHIGPHRVNE